MSDLHTADLFAPASGEPRPIAPGAVLLPGAALGEAPALLAAIRDVLARAPWRQMFSPSQPKTGARSPAAMRASRSGVWRRIVANHCAA